MATATWVAKTNEDLELAVCRQIRQRTWGGVAELKVETGNNTLVVHGRTLSYYMKQLVLAAIQEVLGSGPSPALQLDIEVGASAMRGR
jgi:hypothetical protein